MSRIFVLGPPEIVKLKNLKLHAERNPVSLDDLFDTYNNQRKPAGDIEGFSCIIPDDFFVVFSHEEQPGGLMRHLSVSCPGNGRVPAIITMKLIMEQLGYVNPLEKCYVYMEDKNVRNIAINVIEKI